jgi:preprotein translocase subunit YajC
VPESIIWGVILGKDLAGFLPFVLIALVFWLLILRPQRRRQQDLAKTQTALGPGTEVMLGSGIYGRIASVEDDTVHLEVSPGTTVKVAKQAVVRVLDAPVVEPDPRGQTAAEAPGAVTDPVVSTEKPDEQHP